MMMIMVVLILEKLVDTVARLKSLHARMNFATHFAAHVMNLFELHLLLQSTLGCEITFNNP